MICSLNAKQHTCYVVLDINFQLHALFLCNPE